MTCCTGVKFNCLMSSLTQEDEFLYTNETSFAPCNQYMNLTTVSDDGMMRLLQVMVML